MKTPKRKRLEYQVDWCGWAWKHRSLGDSFLFSCSAKLQKAKPRGEWRDITGEWVRVKFEEVTT